MLQRKKSRIINQIDNTKNPQTLAKWASVNDWSIQLAVARNPYTTGETLEKLSHHEDTLIRYKVAGAINAFPELLDILAKDKDWIVRWAVLKNPRTSKKTRKILLNDEILQGR